MDKPHGACSGVEEIGDNYVNKQIEGTGPGGGQRCRRTKMGMQWRRFAEGLPRTR